MIHKPITDKGRALKATVNVVLASALARYEMAQEAAEQTTPLPSKTYTFTLMAAAAQAQPRLPDNRYDSSHLLCANTVINDGELRLTLQANGFQALNEVAGKRAKLCSPDGAIDIRFGFDSRGQALIVLADSEAVRVGLQHFKVLLF